MNDATERYIEYVRRHGTTDGVEDFVDIGDVVFEDVFAYLNEHHEQTTFDQAIPQDVRFVGTHGYEVVSWSPGAAGAGVPATQVHLLIELQPGTKAIVMLKSAVACDQLIRILQEHRYYVWDKQS